MHRTPSHRSFRVSSDPASFHGTGSCKHSFAPRVSPCLGGFMTTLKSHPCSFQVLHKLSTCGELWIWSKDSAKAPKKQPDWLLVWGCYVGGFAILWILVNFVGLKNSTFYLKALRDQPFLVNMSPYCITNIRNPPPATTFGDSNESHLKRLTKKKPAQTTHLVLVNLRSLGQKQNHPKLIGAIVTSYWSWYHSKRYSGLSLEIHHLSGCWKQ